MVGLKKTPYRCFAVLFSFRTVYLFVSIFIFSSSICAQSTLPGSTSTCSGVAINFVPSGAIVGTKYTWSLPTYTGTVSGGTAETIPQNSIIQTLSLAANATASGSAVYTVTPFQGASQGTPFQLTVTVNPMPVLNSSTVQVAVCSGSPFQYTPTSATAGSSITWSRGLVNGISNNGATGQSAISEILNNITTNPVDVEYEFVINANGCRSDQTIKATINPTPYLTSTLTPSDICSGDKFNYTPQSIFPNTTYTWVRSQNGGINNGLTSSGTGDPNETLTNSTVFIQQAVYTYKLKNNSSACEGTQVVSFIVRAIPTVSPKSVTSCSGSKFNVSPTTVPFGTLYSWSAPAVTGSVSGASAATGQLSIGQTLTNNGAANATVVYNVTPNNFGCPGADFSVTVTVPPASGASAPTLTSILTPPDICSGKIFSYIPQSNATGATYAWERFLVIGISNGPSTGTGNINEILTSTSDVPVTVHYAITTTVNGCSNTEIIAVIVNPTPTLSSSKTPSAICSNTTFSYDPTSGTPNTSFNWTRSAISNIGNTAKSGTGNPLETLINTSSSPVAVTYIYSLITVNGCVSTANSQNVVVVINAAPVITSAVTAPAICSGDKFSYQPTASPNSSFFWTRAQHPSISNGPGAGVGDPLEFLVNSTTTAVAIPYLFQATANGCSSSQTVSVVVNPTPAIVDQAFTICSKNTFTMGTVTVPTNTLYTWQTPVISPVGTVIGSSAQFTQTGVSQQLENQTLDPAIVTYTVNPVAGSCPGVSFKIVVTVNPTPAITVPQILPAVCSGTAFNYTPVNVPIGTTYTWSSPVQVPFNSLTGSGAQPISQSGISQTLSSNNNLFDTATYTVTPSALGCIGNVFTVTVPVKPVPVVNNIIDTICTGSAFSISPSPVPVNTTYTWPTPVPFPFGSIVNGTAQVTSSSTISQVLVNATTAPAQIVYTVTPTSNNCSGTPFTITEVVGNMLAPLPNTTAVICSGTSFDVTPATALPNTTYTWGIPTVTPVGSVVGVSARNTPQKIISQTLTNITTNADTVVYTIQPANTGCKGNTFTATIRILPLPTANIVAPPIICRYPFDTLTINFTGTAPWSFTYTDSIITRTQTGITTPTYKYVVPSTGNVARRTLAISPVQDFACINRDTSFFVQRINSLPVGQINSLHGVYICKNTIDTLFVSSSDSLGYQWTYNGTQIPGITSDSVATLTPGSYNAILTNRFGCIDTAAAPFNLIYVAEPVVKFMYDVYCVNTPIRFTNLTDSSNIGPTQWLWDFGDSTGANTYNSIHSYTRGGDHHVKLTALQQYCPGYITSADSILNIQYPIPAVRMPSVSAYKTQFTPLSARPIAGYRYQWTPTRGLDTPDSINTNFNYQTTQEYLINLISTGGCITKDTMLVRVFEDKLVDIFVPKSFTPNYDGVNDMLYPYLTGIKTFQYFKVYNRFGKLMFETTNPDAGWNGYAGGVQQPMAIYIWIAVGIANDGSKIERRGETLLLR